GGALDHPQEGLLDEVLGDGPVADVAADEGEDRPAVADEEDLEGADVAPAIGVHQIFVRRLRGHRAAPPYRIAAGGGPPRSAGLAARAVEGRAALVDGAPDRPAAAA